ncbi:MAG: efflux RND transporter periplasmic adaptor subunit [Clostridiales bacterium]|nr:efflux RND transporter periplasmic adaptor subunit [Clostridiales bacterium]
MQKRPRWKLLLRVVIILAIISGVVFGAIYVFGMVTRGSVRQAMMAQLETASQTQIAQEKDISQVVSASGIVNLRNEEPMYGANGEQISEVLVEVGDKAQEGQIIVNYNVDDKRETLEKQISQAEINLSNQELTLASMTAPTAISQMRQLQTSVDNAEKSLYDANVTISNTELKIKDQEEAIARAEEDVLRAQKDIDNADEDVKEAEAKRDQYKLLLEVDGISQEQYKQYVDSVSSAIQAKEKLETAKTNSETALTNARNTLRDLERSLESNKANATQSEKSLGTAQETLSDAGKSLQDEIDQINYEKQQNQIRLTKLDLEDLRDQLNDITENSVSLISGTITAVNVSKGQSVTSATVLVTVADFNDLIVIANISEYDIPKIALGQEVLMTSSGDETLTYTGKISKIGDSASKTNASSGTITVVPVEITFDSVPAGLKPGFNLDLDITVAHNPTALVVPITAIKKDIDGSSYVYLLNERILSKRSVTTGIINDMDVEVVTGVNAGEAVIINPTDEMADGMNIDELPILQGAGASNGMMFGGGMGAGRPAMRQSGSVNVERVERVD